MDKLPPDSKRAGANPPEQLRTGEGGTIHNESGEDRHIAPGQKPDSSLSAAKHPFRYIGLAISNLFSRAIDSAYSDIGKFTRKTERALENPFASKKEKEAALNTLIDVLSKRKAADHREANEIDDLITGLIQNINNENDISRLQKAKGSFLSGWSKVKVE